MKGQFERTLMGKRRFATYSVALTTLVKVVKILQERGADLKAISFILAGIDMIIKQLEAGAQTLENKQMVEDFLRELKGEQSGPE